VRDALAGDELASLQRLLDRSKAAQAAYSTFTQVGATLQRRPCDAAGA
jgi:hypothetical protein